MFYSKQKGGFFDPKIHPNRPADAVEISNEVYKSLMADQAAGKIIQATGGGYPISVDPPTDSLEEQQDKLKAKIDDYAGAARRRYVSTGYLVEEEYRLTLEQTKIWRSNGSPAESIPQAIQCWADAAGITAEESAIQIEQAAVAMEQALLNIRSIRLAGKAAIDAAADTDDFSAIAQPYIDQLEAINP